MQHDDPDHGCSDDLKLAVKFFKQASNNQYGNARTRASAAERWASVAHRHTHSSALFAYSLAMDLLERCVLLQPSVDTQHIFITRGLPSLSMDAASCAVMRGEFKKAVELLECSRALLWSKMHRYWQPLEDICCVDEQLAQEFGEVCDQLRNCTTAADNVALSFSHKMSAAVEDERWRRQQFLSSRTVPFARLHVAATEGPVIIVNISDYCSDALIIIHNANSPILVELPKATPKNVFETYSDFQHSLGASKTAFSNAMGAVLRRLWVSVIFPVVEKLKELEVLPESRIWWCPMSALCALPLHAAGMRMVGHQNLEDIYVSSYTPTITALIQARVNITRQDPPSLLIVGQLDSSIPMVAKEIEEIEGLGTSVNTIMGESSTPSIVLNGLCMHPWVHFACHGQLDLTHPFKSSFRLHKAAGFTLCDIMQADLPNAELAFLSACHSAAVGNNDVPDKVLHLAAAVQFCGFRSVVGTLWEMQDKDGPELAQEFYMSMFTGVDGHVDFKNAAKALHTAVKAMSAKKETGAKTMHQSFEVSKRSKAIGVYHWITFIHIGA
ncbi:hypothetical protein GYMLUDRAFT_59317 [Collybiopsis luxurians FD-317 M1]|uniref:CHAT domain-containing protein n=1 Tax=Collybiopsis luxurians FD-317 M1 TaxID=944289 RepID=A0A0D0CEK0_9AGAR|nr:hypothetical protein GYMLUDRAFT_59317 [Collybiopsis luxurians FD-317 M1]